MDRARIRPRRPDAYLQSNKLWLQVTYAWGSMCSNLLRISGTIYLEIPCKLGTFPAGSGPMGLKT